MWSLALAATSEAEQSGHFGETPRIIVIKLQKKYSLKDRNKICFLTVNNFEIRQKHSMSCFRDYVDNAFLCYFMIQSSLKLPS